METGHQLVSILDKFVALTGLDALQKLIYFLVDWLHWLSFFKYSELFKGTL